MKPSQKIILTLLCFLPMMIILGCRNTSTHQISEPSQIDTFLAGLPVEQMQAIGDQLWLLSKQPRIQVYNIHSLKLEAEYLLTRTSSPRSLIIGPESFKIIGNQIWVAGSSMIDFTGRLAIFDKSDGSFIHVVELPNVLTDIEFDGESVWAIDRFGEQLLKFETDTYQLSANLALGNQPFEILYADSLLWITTIGSHSISVIEPTQNIILTEIPVAEYPASLAYVAERDEIWVGHGRYGAISRINTTTFEGQSNNFVTCPEDETLGCGIPDLLVDQSIIWALSNVNNVATSLDLNMTPLTSIDVPSAPYQVEMAQAGANKYIFISQKTYERMGPSHSTITRFTTSSD